MGVDLGIWKYRKDLEPDVRRMNKKGTKTLPCVTFYTWDFGGQVRVNGHFHVHFYVC